MSGRQGLSPASTRQRVTPDVAVRLRTTSGVGVALRLPSFVGVCAALAVAAHALVDRALPAPGALVSVVAVVAAVGGRLRTRERSFEAITAALLGCQAAVHVVLCIGTPTSGAAEVHAHHTTGATAGLGQFYPGHTMLVAHLLASGVAGWWLRKGEEAVWSAVRRVWPRLTATAALPALPVLAAPRHRPADTVRVLRDQLAAARTHPHRGPPAAAASAA